MRYWPLALALSSVLAAEAAAAQDPPAAPDPGRAGAGTVAARSTSQRRSLTLRAALDLALKHSPGLAALAYQQKADAAVLKASDGYPNPEVSVEMEDFLGSGVARGVRALQVTAVLSQQVQLGGKPGARRAVRRTKESLSSLEYEVGRQGLLAEVASAFLEVLAQQRRLANAGEMTELANETVSAIDIQMQAGRATPMEVDKAAIVRSLSSLAEEQSRRALLAARQTLAAVCGQEAAFFEEAQGSLEHLRPLPSLPSLLQGMGRHPRLRARAAQIRYQRDVLALEKSARVPDIALSAGLRWLHATRDRAIVAGVAIPLPLWDRNEGAIGAAAYAKLRAEQESASERLTMIEDLTRAYHALALEHQRAKVLQREIHPKVAATFEATKEGYRIGRFGYLDLLDAQRTLFEVKQQTLDALVAYHRAAIRLAQIAATPIRLTLFEPPDGPSQGNAATVQRRGSVTMTGAGRGPRNRGLEHDD